MEINKLYKLPEMRDLAFMPLDIDDNKVFGMWFNVGKGHPYFEICPDTIIIYEMNKWKEFHEN